MAKKKNLRNKKVRGQISGELRAIDQPDCPKYSKKDLLVIGSILLILLVVTHIFGMITGQEVPQILGGALLLLLNFFFGGNRDSRK